MLRLFTLLAAFCLAAPLAPAQSSRLKPGMPAPPLSIDYWVKGEPVTAFEEGKVYVIEFWATWCPPCKESMPHLSELQERHGEDLVVIGVSNEGVRTVTEFLNKEKWKAVTRYRLATDVDGSMDKEWMAAARQQGIPTSFIVDRKGVVQWIGHPMAMDRPLKQVIEFGQARGGKEGKKRGGKAVLPEEGVADAPAMASSEVGESSEAAQAWLRRLETATASSGLKFRFEEEMIMSGIKTQGPGGKGAGELRAVRTGTVLLGGELGVRVDSNKEMMLGDSGMEMNAEESWVQRDGRIVVNDVSSLSSVQGLQAISVEDARALDEELPMPLSMRALLNGNPSTRNPLDALLEATRLTGFQVGAGEDGRVVLEGEGSPMLAPAGARQMKGMKPSRVRLVLDADSGLPLELLVGESEKPAFRIRFEDYTEPSDLTPELFELGRAGEEPGDLKAALEQQLEMMRSVQGKMGGGGGEEEEF